MNYKLPLILLSIFILTIVNTQQAAAQSTNSSYFTVLKNYILAFNAIDMYNKQVLAAQTEQITSTTQFSSVSAYLLHAVNVYRTSLGLSPVQSSTETCAFAAIRAKEISNSFTHTDFYTRVASHTIPYTQWARATENIAEAPTYKEVVTLWKNSPEHAINMRDNTPYVCIEQYGSYYAYEGMRP